MYINENGECGIPILNVFSLLAAQNTPSVAKRFYGKKGRDVALGIMSFLNLESGEGNDPMFMPLRDDKGKVWTAKDSRITVLSHVARLKDGVPNPKNRPMIPTGWNIKMKLELQNNDFVNENTLKAMIEQGGILGIGTFRPIFGRYSVKWD